MKVVQLLVETYVRGLLSDTRKKNAEAIAWEVGAGRVRALQRLPVSARWYEDAVVAEHQHAVAEMLGSDDGILVIDDGMLVIDDGILVIDDGILVIDDGMLVIDDTGFCMQGVL